ncbi:hypothetical protein KPL71_003450 [Citrus sinensis]|uniref:Uncharacterized protein n=1 Tax=Citrus sinensis TaxID=2711 RepID=A0ACB8MYA6_CITSI|nr:hypothetical protein KPL71_003450 [Citrus sinensis]
MAKGDWRQKRRLVDVTSQEEGNVDLITEDCSRSSYGFVSYFNEQVKRMKTSDENFIVTKEIRKWLGETYKSLPSNEKAKYMKPPINIADYDLQIDDGEQLQQTMGKNGIECRCAPDRFHELVKTFSLQKQRSIREIGFESLLQLRTGRLRRKLCAWLVDKFLPDDGVIILHKQRIPVTATTFSNIMGIHDGGLSVSLSGDADKIARFRDTFKCTGRGISIQNLEDFLNQSDGTGDEFKVAFVLFALATVLCPSSAPIISASFLHTLSDTSAIRERNWASFCYDRLVIAISKFKSKSSAHVGGCLLFLQRGSSLAPIIAWNEEEIKKFMRWLQKQGGVNSDKVRLRDCGNVASFGAVPVDMPQLLQRITEQSDAIQNLTTSINKLSNVIVDLVTMMKQSVDEGQKAAPESTPVHAKAPRPSPKVSPAFENLDENKDPVDAPHDLSNNPGYVPVENTNPIVMDSFFNADDGPLCHGQATETNCQRNAEAFNENTCTDVPYDEDNVTGYMNEPELFKTIRSPYEFRSIKKPSRFQRSPFEKVNDKCVTARYWAGPYVVTSPVADDELQLLTYIFDDSQDENEIIVCTAYNSVTRSSMCSLKPTRWIHSDNSVLNSSCTNLTSFCSGSRWANRFMPNMATCEKIFIPMHDGSNRWFIVVVNIPANSVEIWDSLQSARHKTKIIESCLSMLTALDHVVGEEGQRVYGPKFKFVHFEICQNSRLPQQPYSTDCGLYVMMYMDEPPIVGTQSYKHDSDQARLKMTLKLTLSEFNHARSSVVHLASEYYSRTMAAIADLPPTTGKTQPKTGDRTKLKVGRKKNVARPKQKGHGKRR